MDNYKTWKKKAKCSELDPELFFPIGTSDAAKEQEKKAIDICHSCPVCEECLEKAIADKQEIGVWGGTTEKIRKEMRKDFEKKFKLATVGQKLGDNWTKKYSKEIIGNYLVHLPETNIIR
ncbi:MAG: WhiB family transcriptional regulator [Candidatus Ancillula sp.]|nr:WhiB family transcriptional regulator [Candidatus Ancillula sp.]